MAGGHPPCSPYFVQDAPLAAGAMRFILKTVHSFIKGELNDERVSSPYRLLPPAGVPAPAHVPAAIPFPPPPAYAYVPAPVPAPAPAPSKHEMLRAINSDRVPRGTGGSGAEGGGGVGPLESPGGELGAVIKMLLAANGRPV
jgi:hypothetical protein